MKTPYNENWKPIQSLVGVTADGYAGSNTMKAIAAKLGCQPSWSDIQKRIGTVADGIPGNNTIKAIKSALGEPTREEPVNTGGFKTAIVSQSKLRTGTSAFGRAGDESRLTSVPVPSNYPLTYEGKPVKTVRVHQLVADRVESAFKQIADCYEKKYGSVEAAKKAAPGVYIYGGSYNNRSTTGGGAKSVHAWGLAFDFDPAENWYARKKKTGARLAREEYVPFFDILEKHGFYSLGRKSDCDWMHVQAATWA